MCRVCEAKGQGDKASCIVCARACKSPDIAPHRGTLLCQSRDTSHGLRNVPLPPTATPLPAGTSNSAPGLPALPSAHRGLSPASVNAPCGLVFLGDAVVTVICHCQPITLNNLYWQHPSATCYTSFTFVECWIRDLKWMVGLQCAKSQRSKRPMPQQCQMGSTC